MLDTNSSEKEIISNNLRWFKFFVVLPQLTTILYAVACFVLGIVFTAEIDAIFLLIFWVGGAVFCVLNYVSLKIVLSYQVLNIYLLKAIAGNKQSTITDVNVFNEPDILPEI